MQHKLTGNYHLSAWLTILITSLLTVSSNMAQAAQPSSISTRAHLRPIADFTPPPTPKAPSEGARRDRDYTKRGRYRVLWRKVRDPESRVLLYEIQERTGITGTWITLEETKRRRVRVQGRKHGITYFYRVRAKNEAGIWSKWSKASDGITVDKTNPIRIEQVIDDGEVTSDNTTLHVRWTESSDPESGIAKYKYSIHQDAPDGLLVQDWKSVGLNTEVTATGLNLQDGKTYFILVRAKNNARRHSKPSVSDGIFVSPGDSPPAITNIFPQPGPELYAGDRLTLSADVVDDNPASLNYQFSVDGIVQQAWSPATTFEWHTATNMIGVHIITIEVKNLVGSDSKTQSIYLYLKPPALPLLE